MDGWIALGSGMYVKPIDWEECWVISPDETGVEFALHRHNVDGSRELIGTGGIPRVCAQQVAALNTRLTTGDDQ